MRSCWCRKPPPTPRLVRDVRVHPQHRQPHIRPAAAGCVLLVKSTDEEEEEVAEEVEEADGHEWQQQH